MSTQPKPDPSTQRPRNGEWRQDMIDSMRNPELRKYQAFERPEPAPKRGRS